MRLPPTYQFKDNTQVFLTNGVPIGPEDNPISFSIVGKVVYVDDKSTEIVTANGKLLIKTEAVLGAFVGNAETDRLAIEILPPSQVREHLAKAAPK